MTLKVHAREALAFVPPHPHHILLLRFLGRWQSLIHRPQFVTWLLILFWSTVFAHSVLSDCIDYGEYAHVDGVAPGYPKGIALSGSYAYVTDYEGFKVIDVTNPKLPIMVASIDTLSGEHVAVSGSFAYVAAYRAPSSETFHVVDIENPGAPMIVGSMDISGGVASIVASGSYVYVADWQLGLLVIDVSDPTSPQIVANVKTTEAPSDVALTGSYALVADGSLEIVDVTDPTSPFIVGSVSTSGGHDVAVSGSYAYLSLRSGLAVIDITNPASPNIVGTLSTPANTGSIAVSGGRAYVGTDQLQVVDISDPASPAIVGSVYTREDVGEIAISGSYAYITIQNFGLCIIDLIKDLNSVSVTASVDAPAQTYDVAISGSYAYVAEGSSGFQVVDISNPTSPVIVRTKPTVGTAVGITVSGSYVYIADGSAGFRIYYLVDGSSPYFNGRIDTPGSARRVAISYSHAYVADDLDLQVVDISDPVDPIIVRNLNIGAHDVVVRGPYAYVAAGSFMVLDITQPSDPSTVGVANAGGAVAIALSGPYAYVLTEYNLLVIDIRDSTSPNIVGSVPAGGYDIAVSGSYAYVSGPGSRINVIDVTNPASPTLVGATFTRGEAMGVALSNSFAYVADFSGLSVMPIQCSAPTSVHLSSFRASPRRGAILLEWATSLESDFAGFHVLRSLAPGAGYRRLTAQLIFPPSPYRFFDTEVSEGSTYYYRLEALDRSGETELFGPISAQAGAGGLLQPRLEQSRPNPTDGTGATIPFVLAQSGDVELRILDLSGARVRFLMHGRQEAGSQSAFWDGRDDLGRPVPAGLYLYEFKGPGLHATGRMVKIR